MEFDGVVAKRSSVRKFKNKNVNWKDILSAVDAALEGPFAGNHNNLKFLIVEERDRIEEIAQYCEQSWIANANVVVLICSDDSHLESMYGERGRVYSRQQAGAAIQTFIFKLIDLGLSSCWVGSYADEILKAKLNIPQHIQIEAAVPIGYASGKINKTRKKELDNALFWERWGSGRRPTVFEETKEDFPR